MIPGFGKYMGNALCVYRIGEANTEKRLFGSPALLSEI